MKNLKNRYRYSIILLKQLVKSDFKIRYQNSILGYLWSLLRPLALFLILYIVFVKFLNVGRAVPHYPVYLLIGIVIWNYFVEVTVGSVAAIVSKGDILRKINFPKYVIIVASSISAVINLFLNLTVVAFFMALAQIVPSARIVWLPLLLLELFIFALAVSFFLSAAFVRYRDVTYIWDVFIQGAFYATPILYPINIIPVIAAKVLILNPVAQIIQDTRSIVVTDQTKTISDIYGNPAFRLIPICIVLVVAVISSLYFRSRSKYFAEEV